jgi:predicted sulfurtransferase
MRFILLMTIVFLFSFAQQNCNKGTTTTKSGNSAIVKTNANISTAVVPATDDDAPRISLADAKADFDAGKAVFVDTRAAESYKLEHVKGSINIYLGDFETRYKEIPTDKKIIAYCS